MRGEDVHLFIIIHIFFFQREVTPFVCPHISLLKPHGWLLCSFFSDCFSFFLGCQRKKCLSLECLAAKSKKNEK